MTVENQHRYVSKIVEDSTRRDFSVFHVICGNADSLMLAPDRVRTIKVHTMAMLIIAPYYYAKVGLNHFNKTKRPENDRFAFRKISFPYEALLVCFLGAPHSCKYNALAALNLGKYRRYLSRTLMVTIRLVCLAYSA